MTSGREIASSGVKARKGSASTRGQYPPRPLEADDAQWMDLLSSKDKQAPQIEMVAEETMAHQNTETRVENYLEDVRWL